MPPLNTNYYNHDAVSDFSSFYFFIFSIQQFPLWPLLMHMNNFFLSVFTSSPLLRPQDAVVEGGVLLLPLSTALFFRLGTRPRLVRGWAEKITPCDYFLPNTRMWSSARFYRKTERKKLFIPSTLHSGVFCIVALAGKPVLLLSLFLFTSASSVQVS